MKSELRPIGTEFWYDYGVSTSDSESAATRILYRVVSHNKVLRFPGDKTGEIVERIEPLHIQKAPIIGVKLFDGQYQLGEFGDET